MTTYAVGITKELTGAANARGYLVAQPGSSVLVKQGGAECDVYSDNEMTPMLNPVPTGVAAGTAGVDSLGNLLVFLAPGRNYTATVTVGASVVTVPLPDVSLDSEEPIPAGAVEEAMLAFGVATQAELDAGLATKAPSSGIAQAAVSGLVDALAGKEPSIQPGTLAETQEAGVPMVAANRDALPLNLLDPQFGAVGDGVADDHDALVAFSAAINATGGGCSAYIPDGIYRDVEGGGLSIEVPRVILTFGGGAWISPEAGTGIRMAGAYGSVIYDPHIRIDAGTPSPLIDITTQAGNTSSGTRLYNPELRAYINIPANTVPIRIYDNCTWVKIYEPRIRKNSDAVTGLFSKGIDIRKICNATQVVGGEIAHCTDGVVIDGSNCVVLERLAFEDVVNAVVPVDSTEGGAVSYLRLTNVRQEATTYLLDLSRLSAAPSGPIQVFGTQGAEIFNNPNSIPVKFILSDGIHIAAAGKRLVFGASTGTAEVRETGGNLIEEANVDVLMNADRDGNGSGTVSFRINNVERFRINNDGTAFTANGYSGCDLAANTVGRGFKVKEGSNAKMGVATLVGGTVTVANTSVTATSRIVLTPQTLGTILRPAALGVTARVAGTSFTVMSADATDTSTFTYIITEPV